MAKNPKKRGDLIAFKIPKSITDTELDIINQLHFSKEIATSFFGNIKKMINDDNSIILPLDHHLSKEEQQNLNNPLVRKMLSNLCLSLLRGEVPNLPVMSTNSIPEHPQPEKEIKNDYVKTEMSQETEEDWMDNSDIDSFMDQALDELDC